MANQGIPKGRSGLESLNAVQVYESEQDVARFSPAVLAPLVVLGLKLLEPKVHGTVAQAMYHKGCLGCPEWLNHQVIIYRFTIIGWVGANGGRRRR